MFTVQSHKLFSFHVPQLAALPALERQPVNLAAFMQTDAGELLFAMRTNDMRNIRFHSRRYAQHLLVHLLLSMITQIKRRLVAIYIKIRGYNHNTRKEKRLPRQLWQPDVIQLDNHSAYRYSLPKHTF